MPSPRGSIATAAFLLAAIPTSVLGGNILSTSGYSTCVSNPTVNVTKLNVQYNKSTREIVFDVAGSSAEEQKVEGTLVVTAYGETVYSDSFNPCDPLIEQLCPSTFAAQGAKQIPEEYASKIPSIAYSIPDLDGNVKLELNNVQSGQPVGCVDSSVSNGKTLALPAVSWVASGVAAAALVLGGAAAVVAGGHPGASTSSPSFTETVGWFQGIATTGMLSVQYPQVYHQWTTNFGFSTGLVSWGAMQDAIDGFRKSTGGNLTDDNYPWLKNNVTLVYDQGNNQTYSIAGRALRSLGLFVRQNGGSVDVNGTTTSVGSNGNSTSNLNDSSSKHSVLVSGIQGYVEQLTIPQANTFMTVLLVFAIIVAAIIVVILLFKVILEAWSMVGKLPKWLESWRKRYWWRMAKAITNLVFLLYGTWTLYCIWEFTNGDSWAAKALAGVTLAAFTALLGWFTWRIYTKASQFKKLEGDAGRLYEDKETWIKYSLFYDNFKRDYYMFFVPTIIYMFAKGCVIAGADGHGLAQAGGQIIIEAIFLALLIFLRPHQRRSGRWINIFIQVVRMLSVICVLIFVEELGISQTTKTITGVVLIVVQAVLTASLALLIAINALITIIRENPHARRRRQGLKGHDETDNLTPLDPHNSLLMEPMSQQSTEYKPGLVPTTTFLYDPKGRYDAVPRREESPWAASDRHARSMSRGSDQQRLVSGAARMGHRGDDSVGGSPARQPRLPDLDFGFDSTSTRGR